ncbi:alpha/beta hydrolase [Pseudonocardia sichuanensis]
MSTFDVVVAPGALGDRTTAEEIFARALARRGERGSLTFPEDEPALARELARRAPHGLFGYLPAGPADLAEQGVQGAVIRIDPEERPADRSGCVREHIRGRGIDGLRFAVDVWHFRRRPALRVAYGADPDQYADLRLPTSPGARRHPVAVLVHGGYWRSRWESDLMEPLAADLNARGYATWNLEYRRPDDHGWAATVEDVAAGFAALAGPDVAADLDLDRIVLLGHSAGGQLVVRLAADLANDPSAAVGPALTVSLAGVLDLDVADRRWLGEGAVSAALGGRRTQLPDAYRRSSPIARLPIGSPVAVVCGVQDNLDLLDLSRTYAAAARAAGDEVAVLEDRGDHFSVIDPDSPIWSRIAALVESRLLCGGTNSPPVR